MPKVIIMNANRVRAGKDLAVSLIKKELEDLGETVQVLSFKDFLITATSKFFGLTEEEFLKNYDEKLSNGRWHKDLPNKQLKIGNTEHSQRSALIHVSENVLKPLFGKGVFGRRLDDKIDPNVDYVLVPDSGFIEELEEIHPKYDLVVVSIFADYKGIGDPVKDSRNFFKKEDLGDTLITDFFKIKNSGSENCFKRKIIDLVHNDLA